jgi:uncharacterized BrkB/YihY/UPF0761 family membrane protein
MIGSLKALTFIFCFMVVGTILSEVLYKRKQLSAVIADWQSLLLKVIIEYVILIVASFLYYKLGKH